MKDHSQITLGLLLSHPSETIRRNAMSILKQLQRQAPLCAYCINTAKVECEAGKHIYCPVCEMDPCDIPL